MVIPPRFKQAESFSEGLALVQVNNHYGYIDKTGKIVIAAQFAAAQSFNEGLAAVLLPDGWSYIDQTGRNIAKARYKQAGSFSEGLAAVRTSGEVQRPPTDPTIQPAKPPKAQGNLLMCSEQINGGV
ncbi:MAG: WG repeat-containing protein [Aphanothece sp. CMT-3BRIN-NPC111]|nr:WG repeat-containing protein [Aphanothece sp. CMT-3BRIN-NPC111]